MERTVFCKCSLTPSQFPLSCFAGCLPFQQHRQQARSPISILQHGSSMANKWPEGAGIDRLPKSPLGKQHCQTTGHKFQLTPLWDTPNTRRGMTQTGIDTTLTKAWVTAAASTFHTQESSGPQCSSPAPAAEQFLGSHYSEKN